MPNSGPVGVSASPQSTAQPQDFIGPIPVGPDPHWGPTQIVSGFLAASASYPMYSATADQYLVSSAARQWHPRWEVSVLQKIVPGQAATAHQGQQATVDVTGTVQATFNGSGEFVSAEGPGQQLPPYTFGLVKVNGQWRISSLPQTRLLTETQFSEYYKPQDLYFLNASGENPVLVPDSVFVPVGTSSTTLVTNLVLALLQGPKDTWLHDATSSFPAGTTLIGVTIDGTTAVVNLGGAAAHVNRATLEQISAQLLWTLAAPPAGVPSPIQSVELEINGQAFIPSGTICGTSQGQGQSPVQKQATYACYDPYPANQASFSFIAQGTAWSRCGVQQEVAAGAIGKIIPVFGSDGRVLGVQPCQGNGTVAIGDTGVPSAPSHLAATPTAVAVSPDGEYAAYVSSGKGAETLTIRSLGGNPASVKTLKGQGAVTSLCWDSGDDLWYVQDGNVWMASATGQLVQALYQGSGNVSVVALSVAPDGARIALIVKSGSQQLLELAAINRSGPSETGQRGSPTEHIGIDPGVQLGSNLDHPVALTWYDADNLLVLADTGNQKVLYEVPADGQQSSGELLTPEGATSIAAYGPGNALVAGLSNGELAVSASLEGPWQPLGVRGTNPAYPG
jgi:Lipoprotein LpqB beta-propeller domain/Sporulation and spore germination